uniref:Uncharacterized protein n=1 Tax=Trichogramma kaykai TaxID=54128 RepID=A0ABD2WUQ4_9HYME
MAEQSEVTRISPSWKGRLPNLRDCFKSREIERLLADSIECRDVGYAFVEFVARSGYRDAPKLDACGETILRRSMLLHRCAARRF